MPRFANHFRLGLTQHELDFVNVSNDQDTPVYVDPYAIQILDDIWAEKASALIRSFFKEVLDALRDQNRSRANSLMSHLSEPRETYLGVSRGRPRGRGIGRGQADKLILGIERSKAFKSGILSDLSEMSLYVDGIDRDKISDMTTNVIRGLLVEYTQEQCELHEIDTKPYIGPPLWSLRYKNWASSEVHLPFITRDPVILVPKYIVRRGLSLDSQEFYNRQITDFFVAEHLKANDSLVRIIKDEPKVYKSDVREKNPKSKGLIADVVLDNPEILELYKEIAAKQQALDDFGIDESAPSLPSVCLRLSQAFHDIPSGAAHASSYHRHVTACLTTLFYPSLIDPHKEWEIHGGRKRVDIVYTNAGDSGFFSQRRGDQATHANVIIVECKNYTSDIANAELDQLLGRFDRNRGSFGLLTCRSIDNKELLEKKCLDAASRGQGFIIILTDDDIVKLLDFKSRFREKEIEKFMFTKYRSLLS